MPSNQQIEVNGTGGLRGVLLDPVPHNPDRPVRIQLADDSRVLEVPAGLLKDSNDGSYAVPFSREDIDRMSGDRRSSGAEETVIPVVAEELDVRKREIKTGGIRVHRRVLEHEEEIDMPLMREDVQVRRVLLDQDVDGPLPIRKEGETIVIPVVEEVLVISRRYRLKEEVYITKTAREERHQERVAVRRQEADIQEFDADGRRVNPR